MENPPVIPDFELLRRVGGGSYGEVWLGRSVTGIYRAVKIVDRSRFEDARPFLREFDGIMRFQKAMGNQPRQLALLHVGRDDHAGVLYYVMELADDALAGTDIDPATYVPLTLKELRVRRGVRPAGECVKIGVELASALVELHAAGLIHRDVKPSNIIFVNGLAKLADVGLIASSAQALTSLGTPGYAPPEGSGTASADLYSLGKILYELSTGLDPAEFPRIPIEIAAGENASPFLELNEVLLRACDPDPERRYESAQSLLDELMLLRAGRSVKELNRMRRRLGLLVRVGIITSLVAVVALVGLGAKNYFAMGQIAAQQLLLSNQAKINERFARYTSNLHRAQLALAKEDLGAARAALRQDTPAPAQSDLRGPEWYALWNEMAGNDADLFGEIGGVPVSAMATSPDASLLAVQEGAAAGRTAIWDRAKHTRRIVAADTTRLGGFSADGLRLYVGTADSQVYQLNLATGEHLPAQPVSGFLVQGIGDGRTVLINPNNSSDGTLWLWDMVDQRKTGEWHNPPGRPRIDLTAATVSADRHWLAASLFWTEGMLRKREIVVYNLIDGAERYRVDRYIEVQKLRFSPDGLQLAVALRGPIAIVNTLTGVETYRLKGHVGTTEALAYSADGGLLASGGSDQTVRVWDMKSGLQTAVFRGHEGDVQTLVWLNEKEGFVSGSEDGTCRQWKSSPITPLKRVLNLWPDVWGDDIFSPSGQTIAATNANGEIDLLETATLERRSTLSGIFQPLAFSKNGAILFALSNDKKLIRYDLSADTHESTELILKGSDQILQLSVSGDGTYAAFAKQDNQIEVWNLPSGKAAGLFSPSLKKIRAIAWLSQAPRFAMGDRFGKTIICAVDGSDAEILPIQPSPIFKLAFSSDDKWLAIGREDGHVVIWDASTKTIAADLAAHNGPVDAIVFAPDNLRVITAGEDKNIIFWSVDSFKMITTLMDERNSTSEADPMVASIKFDPTGQRMAVFFEKGRLKVWNVKPLVPSP